MWAALKSDLKEFASGAAEEAIAVGIDINVESTVGSSSTSTTTSNKIESAQGRTDGSVMLANAALSMGEKGLKGLSSVSSMIGGVVAPRNDASADSNSSSLDSAPTAPRSISTPIKAMLVVGEDDEEEEELGWGSDDDDIIDVKIEEDAKPPSSEELPVEEQSEEKRTPSVPPEHLVDKEGMQALQSKLDSVEKERSQLQAKHRQQTGELVELRAKVEELSQVNATAAAAPEGDVESAKEIEALQTEIKQLKEQISEQTNTLSKEHEETIAKLILEKETLDQQLNFQNEQLKQHELLQEQKADASSGEQEQQLLKQHRKQIQELTAELESLRGNLISQAELAQVKEQSSDKDTLHTQDLERQVEATKQLEQALADMEQSYQTALKDAEKYQRQLATLEKEEQDYHSKAEKAKAANVSTPAVKTGDNSDEEAKDNSDEEAKDDSKDDSGVKVEEDELSDEWGEGDW